MMVVELSSQKRCESLNRGSVSNEIKNNNKWVVHVKMWRHDKLQEGKIKVFLMDGVNLFNKFDTKKYSKNKVVRNTARISEIEI